MARGQVGGPSLAKLVTRSDQPLARLHALTTLDGLGALPEEVLERALRDGNPAVRQHAVRLAETRAGTSPNLVSSLVQLVDDSDAKVRLQLACSLGQWEGKQAGNALGRLAVANAHDPYVVAAVMSSALGHVPDLVNAAVVAGNVASDELIGPLLKLCLALNQRELLARLLAPVLAPTQGQFSAEQLQTFAGFLDTLTQSRRSPGQLIAETKDALAGQLAEAAPLFSAARGLLADTKQPVALRVAAARLLGREETARTNELQLLGALLNAQTPGEVQRATLHSLAMTGEPRLPQLLLQDWGAHLPATRAAVVEELMGREPWTIELLQRVAKGQIGPLEIGVAQRDRLIKHRIPEIRTLANQVFALAANADRQRVVDSLRPVLSMTGNAEHGREVFGRVCATCHQLEGVGREVGPNLESVRGHPPEKLLISILDPSREVEPRYLAYTCTLAGGEELYGLIGSETGNGLEMKLPDGTTRTVLRSEIQSLHGSKVSLMPDGLENSFGQQELADLIRYLRSGPGAGG